MSDSMDTTTEAPSSGTGAKVTDALQYLERVKLQFHAQPHKYNQFLDVMKDFKSQAIDTAGVIVRIRHLFAGYPELILGFNLFLPEGYKMDLQMEDCNGATNQAREPRMPPAVEFNQAVNYVSVVKNRFITAPHIYASFLDVLHNYQSNRNIPEVNRQVHELFQGHPDLIEQFRYFLPEAAGGTYAPTGAAGAASAPAVQQLKPASSSTAPSKIFRGLINDPETQVTEAMEGFLIANPHCTKLDGGRDIKVILRADWDRSTASTVALLSGGGDGHAPAHSGFVGEGMLTAAVSGEVFASPSVKAILAAIRAIGRSSAAVSDASASTSSSSSSSAPAATAPGVCLIVKSYTGDLLNFGIALTQARLDGIPVQMVRVGDDVTLPRSKGITGRRGIAGTVIVHKIAGFAAQQGKSLEEVVALAEAAAQNLVSIGVATRACSVPGAPLDSARLVAGQMELGMGIHNEAGMHQMDLEPAAKVVERMIEQLLSREEERDYFWRFGAEDTPRTATPSTPIVLLVNNLGSATATELSIFVKESLRVLSSRGFAVRRLIVGTLMTALDMPGISLTILRLDSDDAKAQFQLQAIDAPTGAAGWSAATVTKDPKVRSTFVPLPLAEQKDAAASSSSVAASNSSSASSIISVPLLTALSSTILSNAARLNALDALSGDGDCGSTLSIGARAVQEALADGSLHSATNLRALLSLLATRMGESMGGSSGAIVQILLTAAAASASTHSTPSTPAAFALEVALALEAGIAAVSQFGGAVVGDRTLLDAMVPAVQALKHTLQDDVNASVSKALSDAASAARAGALSTKGMQGRAGRSNYVSGAALADADPGAEAIALLWATAAETYAASN